MNPDADLMRKFAWTFAYGGWLSTEDADPLRLGIEFDVPGSHAQHERATEALRTTFGGELEIERDGLHNGAPYVLTWTLTDLNAQIAFLEAIEPYLPDECASLDLHWRVYERVQLALPLLRRIQKLQQEVRV